MLAWINSLVSFGVSSAWRADAALFKLKGIRRCTSVTIELDKRREGKVVTHRSSAELCLSVRLVIVVIEIETDVHDCPEP